MPLGKLRHFAGGRGRTARALCLWGALTAAGCGARTGLDAPDPMLDAGTDAPIDSGPDAGPPPLPCIVAPPDAGEVTADLEVPAALAVIDLMFLIDATASMQDEINAVADGLRDTVVPGVRRAIPDAAFGVAFFGEFPIEPHGPAGIEAYQLRSPITTDVTRVAAALDLPPEWGNYDDAEAAIEGLYQVTTGAGYGRPSDPGYIPPSSGCPSGGTGGACFRNDALPIVMLATDAPMHNGPPVAPFEPYEFTPAPASYRDAIDAAARLSALVVTLGASDSGRPSPHEHLQRLSRDTGSVDSRSLPLWFDIGRGGDRIGNDIVNAVEFVAAEVPLDIDAQVEDIPGDGIDADQVLRGVRALSADPPDNVSRIEDDTFFGVIPGTRLTFQIVVDASGLPDSTERRAFPARILFRASGSRLETREFEVVVPGIDGVTCEDEL